jgi:hypothetical protein
MKQKCSRCNETKDISQFNKNQMWCKKCKSEQAKEKREEPRILSNQLCECGCGKYTFLASHTRKSRDWIKGKPQRYLPNHYKPSKWEKVKVTQKKCSTCGEIKKSNKFNIKASSPDNLSSWCKECNSKYLKEWAKNNRDKKTESTKNDYKKNTDTIKSRVKKWRIENPEMKLIQSRTYRARKNGAEGFYNKEQLKDKIDYYGGKCWICGADYQAIDHVKPLHKGGSNWIANLKPICISCNSSKGDKWYGVKNIWKLTKKQK